MTRLQQQLQCHTCMKPTLHQKEIFGFGWSCFFTILTGGIFLPFWLLMDLFGLLRSYRCQTCGRKS